MKKINSFEGKTQVAASANVCSIRLSRTQYEGCADCFGGNYYRLYFQAKSGNNIGDEYYTYSVVVIANDDKEAKKWAKEYVLPMLAEVAPMFMTMPSGGHSIVIGSTDAFCDVIRKFHCFNVYDFVRGLNGVTMPTTEAADATTEATEAADVVATEAKIDYDLCDQVADKVAALYFESDYMFPGQPGSSMQDYYMEGDMEMMDNIACDIKGCDVDDVDDVFDYISYNYIWDKANEMYQDMVAEYIPTEATDSNDATPAEGTIVEGDVCLTLPEFGEDFINACDSHDKIFWTEKNDPGEYFENTLAEAVVARYNAFKGCCTLDELNELREDGNFRLMPLCACTKETYCELGHYDEGVGVFIRSMADIEALDATDDKSTYDKAIEMGADAVVKEIDEINCSYKTYKEFHVLDVTRNNRRMMELMLELKDDVLADVVPAKFINDVIEYMGGANAIEKMLTKKKIAIAQAEIDDLSKYITEMREVLGEEEEMPF